MNKIIHTESSPLAGKTVRLKKEARHHQLKEFGGCYIRIVDWYDICTGRVQSQDVHSQISIQYSYRASRWVRAKYGTEQEVLLARLDKFPVIVHISEIETDNPELPEAA